MKVYVRIVSDTWTVIRENVYTFRSSVIELLSVGRSITSSTPTLGPNRLRSQVGWWTTSRASKSFFASKFRPSLRSWVDQITKGLRLVDRNSEPLERFVRSSPLYLNDNSTTTSGKGKESPCHTNYSCTLLPAQWYWKKGHQLPLI